MRARIELLHRLLAENGSLFVHIDDNELGYLIALVDEILRARRNRISIITFKQSAASGPKSINPGLVTTRILFSIMQKTNGIGRQTGFLSQPLATRDTTTTLSILSGPIPSGSSAHCEKLLP